MNQQEQPNSDDLENNDSDRKEQFNELSELSLEERIAVADQIGVPVQSASDAAITGAMIVPDDTVRDSGEEMDGKSQEQT